MRHVSSNQVTRKSGNLSSGKPMGKHTHVCTYLPFPSPSPFYILTQIALTALTPDS